MQAAARLGPLALLVAGALIAGCGGGEGADAPATTEPTAAARSFDRPEKVLQRGERATAVVTTSHGTFEISLDTEGSPKTTNSFAFLAEEGFYDGTVFHGIVPDFAIQGGDPTGTGTGGPGYSVDERPPTNTEYVRGTVAMAKTAAEPPGRSGSQFFVVTAADAGLPPDYALLGEVSSGMSTAVRIARLGDPASGSSGTPLETVTLETVAIESR